MIPQLTGPTLSWNSKAWAGRNAGRSALASHIRHLAKLEALPAVEPRAGCRQTVLRARAAVDEVLEESPSLRPSLDAVIKRKMTRIRPLVAEALGQCAEAPRVKLDPIEYSKEQVLGLLLPDDLN
jgi:hypothetical protein